MIFIGLASSNYLVANLALNQTLARVFPDVVFQFLKNSKM